MHKREEGEIRGSDRSFLPSNRFCFTRKVLRVLSLNSYKHVTKGSEIELMLTQYTKI